MKYVFGVEGGGTKTTGAIADLNMKILSKKIGGPSNFLMISTEESSKNIFDIFSACTKDADINPIDVEVAMFGLTGAGRINDQEKMRKDFRDYTRAKGFEFRKVIVDSDARISLEAAFPNIPGMILISGTGSILFGKNSAGDIFRVGGWGRIVGDEGSGYYIGKAGLNVISKTIDGREGKNLIFKLINQKFNLDSLENVVSAIYKENFDIASLAPIVLQAAEKKDPLALKIVNEAVNELFLHVTIMLKKLKMKNKTGISFIGSILTNDTIVRKKLIGKIKKRLSKIIIKETENEPVYGAVVIALNQF
jgi:N-acetylglucosamine kinase-like BadF-type ATPase